MLSSGTTGSIKKKQEEEQQQQNSIIRMVVEIKNSYNFTFLNNRPEIIRKIKLYQYTPNNVSCKDKHAQDNHDFKVMNM